MGGPEIDIQCYKMDPSCCICHIPDSFKFCHRRLRDNITPIVLILRVCYNRRIIVFNYKLIKGKAQVGISK